MLELARNPNEQNLLRQSLEDFKKSTQHDEKVDLKLCPHVKMVTREVLRLHPAGALGSTRMVSKEIQVQNPENKNETWIIPKGSFCNVISYVVLRNHHVFGENADEFVPSRWESPTEDMLKAYLPFSAGKRNCQGMALAYLELHAIIARLTANYQMEVDKEGTSAYMVTLRPEGSTIFVRRLEKK
jgi:cytochrome P450